MRENRPSIAASLAPLVVLIALLYLMVGMFGSSAIEGANQIALIVATAVAALISMLFYGAKWSDLERAMVENIRTSSSAIIILLLIGALSGVWMVSGVVPTMIYYGLEILNPNLFLVSASLICAVVSLMTGSSWTTIATIGVALMGVGTALGFPAGWSAGAIISGAYFGDKLSVLSDTTILATSAVEVPIFTHIRYMLITTVPAFVIALAIFFVAGFVITHGDAMTAGVYARTLDSTFNISAWLLVVPMMTGVMIALKAPAMVTLFVSAFMAAVALMFAQPEVVMEIVGAESLTLAMRVKAAIMSCYGATSIVTPVAQVTELISTRGMEGMMVTIWLIICAMCFGGAMMGSGMLQRITELFAKYVKSTVGIVGATLFGGTFFNIATADQYISVILTGRLFKELYEKEGLEARLLSRSVEDSASVGSVLVPWNSCGMAQSAVLGVATLHYLPYCFFNILSP
ncbi:MAG: Na+/H+ antiporter NhaC family protein, partial [Rikenellaceae bacterium]